MPHDFEQHVVWEGLEARDFGGRDVHFWHTHFLIQSVPWNKEQAQTGREGGREGGEGGHKEQA